MFAEPPSLHQRRWLGSTLEFRIQDERTLLCRRRSALDLDETRIDLADLAPQPLRKRRIPAVGWFTGVLLVLLTLGPPILVTCTEELTTPDVIAVWLTCALLFGVPGTFCLVRAWKETYDLTVFEGPHAQVILRTHNPDPRTFDAFVGELRRRIEQHLHERVLLPGADMCEELDRIARLFERGLLSEQEFRVAKQLVLGHREADEAIGFAARPREVAAHSDDGDIED